MKSPQTTRRVIELLSEQHPNADTELHYRNAFELLVATILSAQSTDQRVNMVTPALFARYPDARALSAAASADLERIILSTGFFRQKSKALIGMSQQLVEQHGGDVPADMDVLTTLPGVGRKTANVVLGHALGVPGLPVDRHVLRVANRIGIAESDDPVVVEQQLCERLPSEMWTLTSDVQILHGRRICRPKPLCEQCAVTEYCDYYQHVVIKDTKATKGTKSTKVTKVARGAPQAKRAQTTKRVKATKSAAGAKATARAKKSPIVQKPAPPKRRPKKGAS